MHVSPPQGTAGVGALKPLPPPPMLGRGPTLPHNPAQAVRRKGRKAGAGAGAGVGVGVGVGLGVGVGAEASTTTSPSPPTGAPAGSSGPTPAPAPGVAGPPPRAPVSANRVLAVARKALKSALKAEEGRSADDVGAGPGPGAALVSADGKRSLNVNMSREHIGSLPDEMVDILTRDLERLALSHNYLTTLPPRFVEFASLRYLNLKNNFLEEFPMLLCNLKSLEFLDLSSNKLTALPREISRMAALRVFSIERNKVEELPTSLADMHSLQKLKLHDNPIRIPPKEILQVQPHEVPEGEDPEKVRTANIRRYLRRAYRRPSEKSDARPDPDLKAETRGSSGKRSGSVDINTEMLAASIPSHFDSTSWPARAERIDDGLQEAAGFLGDEACGSPEVREDLRRHPHRVSQHTRGFSYGSAMDNSRRGGSVSSQSDLPRPLYVRELMAVPIRRRENSNPDAILEVAKGVLYAVYHIHQGVQTLMGLTNDGVRRHSSLEMVFYNTNTYFEELELAIQSYEHATDPRSSRETASMQRAYATLLTAYVHVCSRLMNAVDLLLDKGDQRYMRTFLMLIFHSVMELRIAMAMATSQRAAADVEVEVELELELEVELEEPQQTPRPDHYFRAHQPLPTTSTRPALVIHPVSNMKARRGAVLATKEGLRIVTDGPIVGTQTTTTTALPLSGFSSAHSSSSDETTTKAKATTTTTTTTGPVLPPDDALQQLRVASETVLRVIPPIHDEFARAFRRGLAARRRPPRSVPLDQDEADDLVPAWEKLTGGCETVVRQAQAVQRGLAAVGCGRHGGGTRRQRSKDSTGANSSGPGAQDGTAGEGSGNGSGGGSGGGGSVVDAKMLWSLSGTLFTAWAALGDSVRTTLRAGARVSPAAREGLQRVSRDMREAVMAMADLPRASISTF